MPYIIIRGDDYGVYIDFDCYSGYILFCEQRQRMLWKLLKVQKGRAAAHKMKT